MDEAFVALSGLPIATLPRVHQPLNRFLLRKLGEQNPNDMSKIYMPTDAARNSVGLAIVRYATSSAAETGIQTYNGTVLDRHHVMVVERLGASEAFRAVRASGGIDDQRLQRLVALRVG